MIPIFVREAAAIPGKRPAIVVDVAGAIGAKSAIFANTAYFHERGFTYIKAFYRGKPGFGRTLRDAPGGTHAQVQDIISVLREVSRDYKVPPERIVLYGHSDGGMLAAKAAAAGAAIGGLVVASVTRDPEPIAPRISRCVIAFHGDKDELNAPSTARATLERMLGASSTTSPCGRFEVMIDEPHTFSRPQSWGEIHAAVVTALGDY